MQPGVLSAIKVKAATEKYLLMSSGGVSVGDCNHRPSGPHVFSHGSRQSQEAAKPPSAHGSSTTRAKRVPGVSKRNGTSDAGPQETASLCRIWNALSKNFRTDASVRRGRRRHRRRTLAWAAACTREVFPGTGFVHGKVASVQCLSVQSLSCILCFLVRGHRYESEAAGLTVELILK